MLKKQQISVLSAILLGQLFVGPTVALAQQSSYAARATFAPSTDKEPVKDKIAQFLEQSKITYSKVTDTVWQTTYHGEAVADIDVTIATAPNTDMVVLWAVVAEKQKFHASQDLFYKLLKYNQTADYVKVGIDENGDLVVRIDVNGRTIDLEEFKVVINQISAAVDELHGQIRDSLI